MTTTVKRWTGLCAGCGNEREIEPRESHSLRCLCDRCAEQPYRIPALTDSDRAPVERKESATLTAEQWARMLREGLLSKADSRVIALPFQALNESLDGGLRPGEVCLVAGWTSHGKSILVDQIADNAADLGKRVHLYMTEMTAYKRGLRLLARRTGVSHRALKRQQLDKAQWRQVEEELLRMPYGCSIVSDWTVDQVVDHIRTEKWDMAVIDLIHGFHYRDERDLSRTSSALVRASKGALVQTTIVAAAHLNDGQMREQRSPKRPKPGLHAIKGSSSLKQDADVVMFVWQQDDDDGQPTGEGAVWVAKSRDSGLGGVRVLLNPARMTFEVA